MGFSKTPGPFKGDVGLYSYINHIGMCMYVCMYVCMYLVRGFRVQDIEGLG